MEACMACKFVFQEKGNRNLTCRRFPPQVSLVTIPQRSALGEVTMSPNAVSVRPTVQPESWCGEFIPRNVLS